MNKLKKLLKCVDSYGGYGKIYSKKSHLGDEIAVFFLNSHQIYVANTDKESVNISVVALKDCKDRYKIETTGSFVIDEIEPDALEKAKKYFDGLGLCTAFIFSEKNTSLYNLNSIAKGIAAEFGYLHPVTCHHKKRDDSLLLVG